MLTPGDYTDPRGFNVYVYVGNDPFNFTDPSGMVASDVGQRGLGLLDGVVNSHSNAFLAGSIVHNFFFGVGPAVREFESGSPQSNLMSGLSQMDVARSQFLKNVADAGNPTDYSGITLTNCKCGYQGFIDSAIESGIPPFKSPSPLKHIVGNHTTIEARGGPNRTVDFAFVNRTSITSLLQILPEKIKPGSYDRSSETYFPKPTSTIEQRFHISEQLK